VDDGGGIEPELQASLFEPFVQAKTSASGLGLGLSVVRAVAQAHGGSVRVHSSGVPGEGSAFVVRLPCEPALQQEPALVATLMSQG
jgi:signal transduction histidine kinase